MDDLHERQPKFCPHCTSIDMLRFPDGTWRCRACSMNSQRWEMHLRHEKVKAMEPTVCPECKKDTLEKFAMGRAWHCTSCDASNDEYRHLQEGFKLPQEVLDRLTAAGAALTADAPFNMKLKAAGLVSIGDEDFLIQLRAFARVDLGLSDEEFGNLTIAEIDAFLDRYLRAQLALAQDGEESAPTQAPTHEPADWDQKPKEWQKFGMVLIKNRSISNEELCRQIDKVGLECRYGASWEAALGDSDTTRKVFNLINRIRLWVRVPGRTQGKKNYIQ